MIEELQSIADSLAARLQRSVAIDDPRLRLLVHTPHHAETVDRHRVNSIMQKSVGQGLAEWILGHGMANATTPVRVQANEEMGILARVCVPVRWQGILLAFLWLLDADETLSCEEIAEAVESATAAGSVLFREQLLGDLRRHRDGELLRDLLASDMSVREHAAQELVASDRLPDGAHVAVLALQVLAAGHEDCEAEIDLAMQRAGRRLAPLRAISTTRGDATRVLLVAGRHPSLPDRLRTVATELRSDITSAVGHDTTVRIGIGPVVEAITSTHESHTCAQDALRVAGQVPGLDDLAAWDALGIYRLLVQHPHAQLRDKAIPAGLLRLLQADPSGVLIETLEVYLDEAGQAPATIARLNIHRTSLYHRFNRIEKATGMSLASGSDRLAYHLGIKSARLVGLWPTSTSPLASRSSGER